jgi:pimeloyl-ACP methyl ester carboxylesterase
MKKTWQAGAAAILMLMAVALTPGAAADPLELRSCKVPGVEEQLRCGDLLLPENPAQPEGRQIKLHFVVIPAVNPGPHGAALFDLAGGPGLAATSGADFFATIGRAHRLNRDVVLIDQRGTGESSPLRCPELELASALEPMYPSEAVRRCRKTLARHADLSQYNTRNTVADLEAVRTALGYAQVDLIGISYGTRLALAYIDEHPERVRAAVLFGVVPADAKMPLWHARQAQRTLDQLFEDCEQDPRCRESYPGLRDRWNRVLRNSAFDGPAREAFRTLLLNAESQRRLPLLIDQMAGGDFESFRGRFARTAGSLAGGLYLSVVCSEDTHAITSDERRVETHGSFLGTYRVDQQSAACTEWNVPPVTLTYGTAKRDVPVLAILGDRDYVTPSEWAGRVLARSPRSRVVVVPKLGHMPDGLEAPECFDSMILSFFGRGDVSDVDASCVAAMKPPPFAPPVRGTAMTPR